MSYKRNLSVRVLLPVILAMASSMLVEAAERSRVWTNTKNKTVEGILQEKGDGWAKILIKGKVYQIELDTLIEADQEYIKNAKLGEEPAPDEPAPDKPAPDEPAPDEPAPDEPDADASKPKEPMPEERPKPSVSGPVGEAVALKVSDAEPDGEGSEDGKYKPQRLKFEVKDVPKPGVHCILVWMANFRSGGGTQQHSTSQDFFAGDGEYFIQEQFSTNAQSGASYKGHAVRLLNTKYERVAEHASDPTFMKELDDAQRRLFPGTLPDPEEDE